MNWAVKPKTQIFEGLGWYYRLRAPLGEESSGTINEHGNNVVRPVNEALTIWEAQQLLVASSIACSGTLPATTQGDSAGWTSRVRAASLARIKWRMA